MGGTLLAVLVVALLLPIVALASRPDTGGGRPLLGADPARLIIDVASYLFVVLLALSLGIIIWALWPRPGEEMPALPPRRRWALSTVLSTLAAVALAVWLRSTGRLPRLAQPPGAGGGGAPPASSATGPVRTGASAGLDLLAAAIVLAAVLAAAFLVWWFLLRPRRRTGTTALARLRAVLDDAIDDVLAEADPRRAVIAAWARLERVLARHGLPRRDSEAPFEYAAREFPGALVIGRLKLSRIFRPARAPKTKPSSKELLASRLAPWTPVPATSPAAKRPARVVWPSRSVRTPPIA